MVILVDTREGLPYPFQGERYAGVEVVPATLKTGDYSLQGYESDIIVERKTIDDLMGSITHDRSRFKREMLRANGLDENGVRDENLTPIKWFYLVIEATSLDISRHRYESAMKPHAVFQTLWSWQRKYGFVPVYAGNRDGGEYHIWSIFRWFIEHGEGGR